MKAVLTNQNPVKQDAKPKPEATTKKQQLPTLKPQRSRAPVLCNGFQRVALEEDLLRLEGLLV